jgi:hypothetical protein
MNPPISFRCDKLMEDRIEGVCRGVGEFCPSNIARLLPSVVIIVTLLSALGAWLYRTPGHGTSIEQPVHSPAPTR